MAKSLFELNEVIVRETITGVVPRRKFVPEKYNASRGFCVYERNGIMKKIKIADSTLCRNDNSFSFKEKIEIARQLEKLSVDVIELPEIKNSKTDTLLIRTISSFVKNSTLCVAAGSTVESIDEAANALNNAQNKKIRIELPVSPVGMEYFSHKKAPKMLEWIEKTVSYAKEKVQDVEFSMLDASRAEPEFLMGAIKSAEKAGATSICFCDSAGQMLPDDFAGLVEKISNATSCQLSVSCCDNNGLACGDALLAVKKGASCVKTAVEGDIVELETFSTMIKNCGENFGISSDIKYTELNRIIKQVKRITDSVKNSKNSISVSESDKTVIKLDKNDEIQDVIAATKILGYDLSEEDSLKVYEEFQRVAEKKNVGAKELDAIVASAALQVPETYKIISYVINNGNIISSSAQITLEKLGVEENSTFIYDPQK